MGAADATGASCRDGVWMDGRDGGGDGGISAITTAGLAWLACSRAVAKAWTVAKRWVRSLARAVSTMRSTSGGSEGTFSCRGGGGAYICWVHSSVNDPRKGRSPLSHSYTTIPSEYWSLAGRGFP